MPPLLAVLPMLRPACVCSSNYLPPLDHHCTESASALIVKNTDGVVILFTFCQYTNHIPELRFLISKTLVLVT